MDDCCLDMMMGWGQSDLNSIFKNGFSVIIFDDDTVYSLC